MNASCQVSVFSCQLDHRGFNNRVARYEAQFEPQLSLKKKYGLADGQLKTEN